MSSKLPDILENTKTVQNARKFEEMDGADMAICGYHASFVTVSAEVLRGGIMNKLAIALGMSSPKKESEVATSLVNHICSQCEHALRTSDERHHLLRYLPMKYSKIGNRGLTGSLDTDKEILGTICALGGAPHSKYVGEKYNNAPIVFAPTRVCPSDSFLERAE